MGGETRYVRIVPNDWISVVRADRRILVGSAERARMVPRLSGCATQTPIKAPGSRSTGSNPWRSDARVRHGTISASSLPCFPALTLLGYCHSGQIALVRELADVQGSLAKQ